MQWCRSIVGVPMRSTVIAPGWCIMNLTRDWFLAGYILLLTISPLAPTGPLFPRTPGSP